MRALADTLPQMLWIARADGVVEYWNAAMTGYTGRAPHESPPGADWSHTVHPDDLEAVLALWNHAVAAGKPFEYEARLRRHDGRWRWFLSNALPVRGPRGAVDYWVGTEIDIEDRKRAEQHMRYLSESGDLLVNAFEIEPPMQLLAERATAEIADLATIWVLRPHAGLEVAGLHHRDPERLEMWREARRRYALREGDLVLQCFATGKPVLIERVGADLLDRISRDQGFRALLERFDVASAVFVPLIGRSGVPAGVLQLANGERSRGLDAADLRFAEVVAHRLALALETTQTYERERRVSETFQHAALPKTLPSIPGVALTAVYEAGRSDVEIGGDWYDALVLPDGRVLLSIGDVAGKGLEAAVLMATVRQSIRTMGLERPVPAAILNAAARVLAVDAPGTFVSAWVGVLDPGSRRLLYAFAGHPRALVRNRDGGVRMLEGEPQPPLGVGDAAAMRTQRVTLAEDAMLVLYTDGLIEAQHDVPEGERRLLDVLGRDALSRSANPARFIVDTVLAGGARDDVAVLTITLGARLHWGFHSGDAGTAQGARAQFVARLVEEGTPESDFAGAELIFGELVGNVVRHAPGAIDIDLDWEDGEAVLHVMDRGRHFQAGAMLPDDTLSESGRGLFLVATLGRDLRVEALPRGNHLRVTLPVRRRNVLP